MITIYIFFIVKILNNKNKNNLRLFYLTLFLLYGYILTISSLFGFQEGQRFMHYGIIIQFLFFIELLKSKFKIKLFKNFSGIKEIKNITIFHK